MFIAFAAVMFWAWVYGTVCLCRILTSTRYSADDEFAVAALAEGRCSVHSLVRYSGEACPHCAYWSGTA